MMADELLPQRQGAIGEDPRVSEEEFDNEDQILEQDDFEILKEKAKQYVVTPRGMVGSERSKWKGDI